MWMFALLTQKIAVTLSTLPNQTTFTQAAPVPTNSVHFQLIFCSVKALVPVQSDFMYNVICFMYANTIKDIYAPDLCFQFTISASNPITHFHDHLLISRGPPCAHLGVLETNPRGQ